MLYFIQNYFTDELIDIVSNDFSRAEFIAARHENSVITDENGNTLYTNIDLPF